MSPAEVIAEELGPQALLVDGETDLMTLDLESLEFLELCHRLEQVFDVVIPDQKIAEVKTVGELCRVVDDLRAARIKEISDYVSS